MMKAAVDLYIFNFATLFRKYKWQYFLIDFCYFGNTFMLIALW